MDSIDGKLRNFEFDQRKSNKNKESIKTRSHENAVHAFNDCKHIDEMCTMMSYIRQCIFNSIAPNTPYSIT